MLVFAHPKPLIIIIIVIIIIIIIIILVIYFIHFHFVFKKYRAFGSNILRWTWQVKYFPSKQINAKRIVKRQLQSHLALFC